MPPDSCLRFASQPPGGQPERRPVLIDGRDARVYALHELRRQMAIVPQDMILFDGSIAENIAYGKPSATEAVIREAARKANAHHFIHGCKRVCRFLR